MVALGIARIPSYDGSVQPRGETRRHWAVLGTDYQKKESEKMTILSQYDKDNLNRSYGVRGWHAEEQREKKARVEKEARKLLALMKGTGWTISIGENLGWYYSVHNGNLYVHPLYSVGMTIPEGHQQQYGCLMSDDPKYPGSGSGIWHIQKNYHYDPNESVRIQVAEARCVVNRLIRAIETAERIVGDAQV